MERLSHKSVVQDRREGLGETCHTILPVSTPNKFVVATSRDSLFFRQPIHNDLIYVTALALSSKIFSFF